MLLGIGPASGATTACLALAAAMARRGTRAATAVARQDFIDATRHLRATAAMPATCDPRLYDSPEDAASALYRHARSEGADVVLADFPGGFCADNAAPLTMQATPTATQTAHALRLPVLLVADAATTPPNICMLAAAGVAAALHPLPVLGVVLNNCPRRIAEAAAASVGDATKWAPLIGALPHFDADAQLNRGRPREGLASPTADTLDALADAADTGIDMPRLLECMAASPFAPTNVTLPHAAIPTLRPALSAPPPPPNTPIIAVACDAAFRFHYAENLALLRELGAEVTTFAPLNGELPPVGTQLVVLGGGIAEVHFERLTKCEAFLASLRQFAARGGCILAEGATAVAVLCRSATSRGKRRLPMADVLPFHCAAARDMASGLVSVSVDGNAPGLFHGVEGATRARGAIFHSLEVSPIGADYRNAITCAYRVTADGDTMATEEGYSLLGPDGGASTVSASLVHLFLPSTPQLAQVLVERARESAVCFDGCDWEAYRGGGALGYTGVPLPIAGAPAAIRVGPYGLGSPQGAGSETPSDSRSGSESPTPRGPAGALAPRGNALLDIGRGALGIGAGAVGFVGNRVLRALRLKDGRRGTGYDTA